MISQRLFYALWPDADTRTAITRLQSTIQGRLTQTRNLHMTLAFLGQQPSERMPPLQHILSDLPIIDMPLVLDRIGYFSRNRIAWIGMSDVPATLIMLQQRLMQDLDQHAIQLSSSTRFQPHVTLARDALPPPDIQFDPLIWQTAKVALVRSTSDRGGVLYQVLASQH